MTRPSEMYLFFCASYKLCVVDVISRWNSAPTDTALLKEITFNYAAEIHRWPIPLSCIRSWICYTLARASSFSSAVTQTLLFFQSSWNREIGFFGLDGGATRQTTVLGTLLSSFGDIGFFTVLFEKVKKPRNWDVSDPYSKIGIFALDSLRDFVLPLVSCIRPLLTICFTF